MNYNGVLSAMMAGVGASLLVRVMNGLSTWVFSDTIGNLAVERFGGVN